MAESAANLINSDSLTLAASNAFVDSTQAFLAAKGRESEFMRFAADSAIMKEEYNNLKEKNFNVITV